MSPTRRDALLASALPSHPEVDPDAGEMLFFGVPPDAADLRAKAVARVHLPARVPYGFRGTWVPASRW